MTEPTVPETATKSPGKPERTRTSDSRIEGTRAPAGTQHPPVPAAGAHAADHLLNRDATPGAGVLPGVSHGREVDGAAG